MKSDKMVIYIDDGMQSDVGTGIGKYTQYICRELEKRNDVELNCIRYSYNKKNRKMLRIKYLKYINSYQYMKKFKNNSWAIYTNYTIPFIRKKDVKYVSVIHDLVAFLYPDMLPKFYRIYNQKMIKYAVYNSDAIITVSNSVKNEILKMFPDIKIPILVVNNGVDFSIKEENIRNSYTNLKLQNVCDKKYFLFVGTIEKRKNIGVIIKAFIELKKKYNIANDYKLVLAGRMGFGSEDYVEMVNNSNCTEDIIFTGYINDEDRNKLYVNSKAFIFPSIYEGFGVPQIECMSCGIPIILSDIPVNNEVSGEYGVYFKLNDVNDLTSKMLLFIENKIDVSKKREIAKKKIKQYDWKDITNKMVIDLKNICGDIK